MSSDSGPRDPDRPDDSDPLAAWLNKLGGGQLGGGGDLSALVSQMQAALGQLGAAQTAAGAQDPGVRWRAVHDLARKTAASAGADPTPSRQQREAVADAVRLAQTWLDEATELPASSANAAAWSRAEWIEGTHDVWRRLVEPVAESMAEAMAGTLKIAEDGPEAQLLAGMEHMLKPMLRNSGAHMFGLQAGQAIGELASHVLSGTDNGLGLLESTQIALLPTAIDEFADGLDAPAGDVLIYLALREAARQRLFAHAPWLRPQVLALVEGYARGITIDTSRMEDLLGDTGGAIDQQALARIAEELQANTLFTPARTPEQDRTLERLETLLALVEGWVDDVVEVAAERWLPQASALAETIRRRRGSGGPAEATLAKLVGLELRPRKVREAAQLWRVLRQTSGAPAREAAWTHPDLLPSASDLADPLGFKPRGAGDQAPDDMDAELAALLDGDDGEDAQPRG